MTKNRWLVATLFIMLLLSLAAVFGVLRPMRKEELIQKSPATKTNIEKQIIGTWKSTEDSKYIIIFMPGGRLSEKYDSKTVSEGTWEISSGKDLFQLKETIDGEAFLFEIVTITDSYLTLTALARGNTLIFKKVNEN